MGVSDTCRLRLVRTLCFVALLVAAVESINAIAAEAGIEFVASIGDIADDGTIEQYEAATAVLSQLTVPHYAIMGNEEFGGGQQRFLDYAARWNKEPDTIPAASYVVERHGIAFVFATPDRNGRDFTDGGVAWVEAQLQSYASVPVFLFTHGAPKGGFPDGGDKSISNPAFARVLEYENLRATFSGDLHMDLDRTTHFVIDGDLAHIHVPALERTKIPDTLRHTGRYRIVSVLENGTVMVNTVDVLRRRIEPMHTHAFKLSMVSVMPSNLMDGV